MEDLVVGEDRVQRYTEQEVLQSNPAALHKVWVHVVSGQLVPHELSLLTNTSAACTYTLIHTITYGLGLGNMCNCDIWLIKIQQILNANMAKQHLGLSSPASQAVEEQQCVDRSPPGSSAEVQIHCIAATESWGQNSGLQRLNPLALQKNHFNSK